MSSPSTELADRATRPDEVGIDTLLEVPLLRLLAAGNPVPVDDLAAEVGRPTEEVRARLAADTDTEYDDEGRIIGKGLTLRPTAHRFTMVGQELYTWCALDTLMFPSLIGKAAHVESVSPTSGEPIRLTADPHGASDIEPADAVVSVVSPDAPSRSSFCDQVHFFTSHEDAEPWLAVNPEAEVLPVADAYKLGLLLLANALSPDTPSHQPNQRCSC